MRIHREGYTSLLIALLFLGALNAVLYGVFGGWLSLIAGLASLVFYVFLLQFFRNHERIPPAGENQVISPADGKVVVAEKVFEEEYLHEERLQLSIFMSPLDAHLNRVPVSGELSYYRYYPGKYLAAYNPKSSQLNERNAIGIRHPEMGYFLFRQIAGVVARRITFYHREGDVLTKGEELGFIKFGSRMDLFLPLSYHINVKRGEQVYAGKTLVATPEKQAKAAL